MYDWIGGIESTFVLWLQYVWSTKNLCHLFAMYAGQVQSESGSYVGVQYGVAKTSNLSNTLKLLAVVEEIVTAYNQECRLAKADKIIGGMRSSLRWLVFLPLLC